MYLHPSRPELQSIRAVKTPAYEFTAEDHEDRAAALILAFLIAVPVGSLAFVAGYLSGVWGWFL